MPFTTTDDAWREWTPAEVKKHYVAIWKLPDGQFEGFMDIANNIPAGAVKMSPQPPYPHSDDPTAGTRKAIAKLKAKHPGKIHQACCIAVELCRKNLTVHSRMVREEMARRGLIGPDTGREFWLGAAMTKLANEEILAPTHDQYKYSDSSRGIHERKVQIWKWNASPNAANYPPLPANTKPVKE